MFRVSHKRCGGGGSNSVSYSVLNGAPPAHLPNAAAAVDPLNIRVAGIAVTNTRFLSNNSGAATSDNCDTDNNCGRLESADFMAALWLTVDLCDAAEQRALHTARAAGSIGNNIPTNTHCTSCISLNGNNNIQAAAAGAPSALVIIDVNIDSVDEDRPAANAPILGPLTTNHPEATRSLRVLTISENEFDESDALGAFAALATHLRELNFNNCGLTSVRGLEGGRCEYLRSVKLWCCTQLRSLSGLEDHQLLEVVEAPGTGITSLAPLLTCPALRKVEFTGCQQLASLQGLEYHQWLEVVDVSFHTHTQLSQQWNS